MQNLPGLNFMLGEDIGIYGGAFGVSGDLYHRFGAERVRDTPISELGIVGAAVGAALVGMKPIVEIQFSDFTAQAMDHLRYRIPCLCPTNRAGSPGSRQRSCRS